VAWQNVGATAMIGGSPAPLCVTKLVRRGFKHHAQTRVGAVALPELEKIIPGTQ
jgi:hypothetical protein